MDGFNHIISGMNNDCSPSQGYNSTGIESKGKTIDISRVDFNNMGGVGSSSKSRGNHNRQLLNMSTSALNNILMTYKNQLASPQATEEDRAILGPRVRMIEHELSTRGESVEKVIADVSSPQAQEKKLNTGTNVGTGALVFGIFGFMGAALMGSKRPFMWGFAGAGAGAVASFFLSQDKSFKLINPIQKAS